MYDVLIDVPAIADCRPVCMAPGSFLFKRGLKDHEPEIVELVKDLLGRDAVAKLLSPAQSATRKEWARTFYAKRYALPSAACRSIQSPALCAHMGWSGLCV